MAQHPFEPADEVTGQAAAVGVERLEVGVEVLTGAVHAVLEVRFLADGAVAAQLGEVGQYGEQVELVLQGRAAGGRELVPRREVVGERARLVTRVEVVAQEHGREVGEAAAGTTCRVIVGGCRRQVEVDVGALLLLDLVSLLGSRLEPHQGRAGLDLAPGGDEELLHPRRERCGQHRLHLHALEHEHGRAGRHDVADGDRGADHQGRRG